MSVTYYACDQDAGGAETAVCLVITTRGTFQLCGHHYREHAFMLGMMGYPVLPIRGTAPMPLEAGTEARTLGAFI
jgi:hypothetical protein